MEPGARQGIVLAMECLRVGVVDVSALGLDCESTLRRGGAEANEEGSKMNVRGTIEWLGGDKRPIQIDKITDAVVTDYRLWIDYEENRSRCRLEGKRSNL
jgi:hypothetical protein